VVAFDGASQRPLERQFKAELLRHWMAQPRPQQASLSGGWVVENFAQLEMGAAIMTDGTDRFPLVVSFPPLVPGCVQLPADLDADDALDMSTMGHHLDHQQVSALAAQGPDAGKCGICLCEMEADVGNGAASGSHPGFADVGNVAASGSHPGFADVGNGAASGSHPGFRIPAAGRAAGASSSGYSAMELDDDSPGGGGAGNVFELKCGHAFHKECLEQWFLQRKRCPACNKDFGKVFGTQPDNGRLQWSLEGYALPGHPDSQETILIEFAFPPGVDGDGNRYQGRQPQGYLPHNAQGIILLELFKIAFRRRVMFGLGRSMTYDSYRPTFNVHIKTSTRRGVTGHGYPDPDYFQRALEELRGNCITIADLLT